MIDTRIHAHRRLLFNVVRTHIVRMHAINLYTQAKEVHAVQNAREKFPHLTKRSKVPP